MIQGSIPSSRKRFFSSSKCLNISGTHSASYSVSYNTRWAGCPTNIIKHIRWAYSVSECILLSWKSSSTGCGWYFGLSGLSVIKILYCWYSWRRRRVLVNSHVTITLERKLNAFPNLVLYKTTTRLSNLSPGLGISPHQDRMAVFWMLLLSLLQYFNHENS